MVDAFSFTDGQGIRSFKSRAEMFDWMIDNGHVFLEGDFASKMLKHVNNKINLNANDNKAKAIKTQLEYHGVE